MNEAETRAELIDPKLKAFNDELAEPARMLKSPGGAGYVKDGYSPSDKK
ncbi:MAG: hypothetical protein ACJAS3_003474 [Roseivirga sp.]|jgi:hypothetical protein